jgi:hypothetical protein
MRVVLAPLLAIVFLSQWIYSLLSISPEIATVAFIVFGGALVGLVYIMPVMLSALWVAGRKRWRIPALISLKPVAYLWMALIAAVAIGAVLRIDIVAVLSSGMLFACTVFLAAGGVSLYISGYLGIPAPAREE